MNVFRTVLLLLFANRAMANTCTYDTWDWDVNARKVVNPTRVVKDIKDLTPSEKDPHSSCTVCEQDQVEVKVPGVVPFRICREFHAQIAQGLQSIVAAGWPVKSVTGYRVGKTRGPVDAAGRRTEFSNHSFGSALDINAENNGLYDNCIEFGSHCRLIQGGPWIPQNRFAITRNTPVYELFRTMGWKWGGEIAGKQKDFMHFSVTGY